MDSAPTCILVLAVSMLATCSHEFTQKCQYSPSNLIKRIYERMKLNVPLYKVYSLCRIHGSFHKFSWVTRRTEMGPMWLISPPLWHACCRQTNYLQNMHSLKCAPTSALGICYCLQAQEVSHAWFMSHSNMNPLIRTSVNTEKRITEKITEISTSLAFLALTLEQR